MKHFNIEGDIVHTVTRVQVHRSLNYVCIYIGYHQLSIIVCVVYSERSSGTFELIFNEWPHEKFRFYKVMFGGGN